MTKEEYLSERREAAKRLDPETATVFFDWGNVIDPYDVCDDLSPEEKCVGRRYFARSPEEGVVSIYDLRDETRKRLNERLKTGAFDDEETDIPF